MTDVDDVDTIDLSKYAVPPSFHPGDRCKITPGDRAACVMFIGPVTGMPAGYWVGVQYDEKVGKNDGSLNGKRYFSCPPGHGGFLRATKIHKLAAVEKEAREQEVAREDLRKQKQPKDAKKSKGEGAVEEFEGGEDQAEQQQQQEEQLELANTARRRGMSAWEESTARQSGGGVERNPDASHPYNSMVSGSGLTSAVVGSLAQFTIIAYDGKGERVTKGGDNFTVQMRGLGREAKSQPAYVRTKLTDRGDGTYMCEYRPYMTGRYSVEIRLDDFPIKGSPFTLSVITLRPDAAQCIVRGAALHHAVARQPHKFEVLFVDAIGHVAHAEELDVHVEPTTEPFTSPPSPPSLADEPSPALSTGAGSADATAPTAPTAAAGAPAGAPAAAAATAVRRPSLKAGEAAAAPGVEFE